MHNVLIYNRQNNECEGEIKEMPMPARQATLPRGSFWQDKLIASDDLGHF
jgi:hypothetical protein